MIEHFIEMMAGSLRLKEPWFVESAKFDLENQRVDIYVAVRPEAVFTCPECGGAARQAADTSSTLAESRFSTNFGVEPLNVCPYFIGGGEGSRTPVRKIGETVF